jgi:hypothetical protein
MLKGKEMEDYLLRLTQEKALLVKGCLIERTKEGGRTRRPKRELLT